MTLNHHERLAEQTGKLPTLGNRKSRHEFRSDLVPRCDRGRNRFAPLCR
jgi:hypothetical protein